MEARLMIIGSTQPQYDVATVDTVDPGLPLGGTTVYKMGPFGDLHGKLGLASPGNTDQLVVDENRDSAFLFLGARGVFYGDLHP